MTLKELEMRMTTEMRESAAAEVAAATQQAIATKGASKGRKKRTRTLVSKTDFDEFMDVARKSAGLTQQQLDARPRELEAIVRELKERVSVLEKRVRWQEDKNDALIGKADDYAQHCIAAERERAARIAEDYAPCHAGCTVPHTIAAAIRGGK